MLLPLTGGKFKLFRDRIMNLSGKHHRIEQQECVGRKVSVSNEHESNESTMERDSIKEKADESKKRVVTAKDPVLMTKNMEESVLQRKISKGLKVKGQKE